MPKKKGNSAQTSPIDNSPRLLSCLIKGQGGVFTVPIMADQNVFGLKELIYEKGKKSIGDVDATTLVLLKVSEHSGVHQQHPFFVRSISLSLVSLDILFDNLK